MTIYTAALASTRSLAAPASTGSSKTTDTGDAGAYQADTIHDFNDFEDVIYLKGSYTYADNTNAPGDGQYSVWNNGNAWVITWNAVGDVGYHDLLVKGSNPLGDIAFY